MELAKDFDKKSKQLDMMPKRDLNRPGLTFGALLEQHFPIPAPTSLRASEVPPSPGFPIVRAPARLLGPHKTGRAGPLVWKA
jgi:hypothetical protein